MFFFFILMISVLYFIRKISAAYNKKTNSITINGNNISLCILLEPIIFMLAGWCSVAHHSTEYLMIGKLIDPIIAIIEETFTINSSLFKSLNVKI